MPKPAAAAAVSEQPTVAISLIDVTPNVNFRTEFKVEDLEELASSIKVHGVVEPIVVRPKGRRFELIAGERRLRAAKLAKLTEIPVVVRDVDDKVRVELQMIENLQRVDLHPLEYAAGFVLMQTAYGYDVKALAEKAHKGETFIRELLGLAKLPENARKAFLEETISKSIAVLIATIPDAKQREKYAAEVIKGDYTSHHQTMSFRQAKKHKETHYMRELKDAPFPRDEQLDPGWPYSCLKCPHYNGNTPEKYQGKRADICLNPLHFDRLLQIWGDLTLAKIEKKDENNDVEIIPQAKGREMFFDNGYLRSHAEWVDLGDTSYDERTKSNVSKLKIAREAELKIFVTVDAKGKLRKLAKHTSYENACTKLKVRRSYGYTRSASDVRDKQRLADQTAARKATTKEVLTRVGGAAVKLAPKFTPKQRGHLLTLLVTAIRRADNDVQRFLSKHFELDPEKGSFGGSDFQKTLIKYAKSFSGPRSANVHWSLLAQVSLMEELQAYAMFSYNNGLDANDIAAGMAWGVDIRKVQAAQVKLVAEKRAETKAKVKAKGKVKAKAARA